MHKDSCIKLLDNSKAERNKLNDDAKAIILSSVTPEKMSSPKPLLKITILYAYKLAFAQSHELLESQCDSSIEDSQDEITDSNRLVNFVQAKDLD